MLPAHVGGVTDEGYEIREELGLIDQNGVEIGPGGGRRLLLVVVVVGSGSSSSSSSSAGGGGGGGGNVAFGGGGVVDQVGKIGQGATRGAAAVVGDYILRATGCGMGGERYRYNRGGGRG